MTTTNSPMQRLILMQRAVQDNKLAYALKFNMNRYFYGDLMLRAMKNKNIMLSWWGPQGYGKSFGAFYVANQWSILCNNPLNATRDVAFNNDELLPLFDKATAKEIKVKDEQIKQYGAGSDREEDAIENIGAVVRARQLSLIYCSPGLKLHQVHYVIESTGIIDETTMVAYHILYEGSTEKPIGYISTGKPNLPETFWTEYNQRKDAFIGKVIKQETNNRTDEYAEIADKFISEFVLSHPNHFKSKAAVITKMQQMYRKNFGNEEWKMIRHIIDDKCKEQGLNPYNLSTW